MKTSLKIFILILLLPLQTMAAPEPIQLEIDLSFVLQPISPQVRQRIVDQKLNLEILDLNQEKFYIVLPDAVKSIQQLSKDARYQISFYAAGRSQLAAQWIARLDPTHSSSYAVVSEHLKSKPGARTDQIIELSSEDNLFPDYDFFESYEEVSFDANPSKDNNVR